MKKVTLAVALVALCGLAASTFADVQNIRLSGDIRIRGYLSDKANAQDVGIRHNDGPDAQFITQRTRVTVEADLEDHVTAVVTLQATGIWGNCNSGETTHTGTSRTWDVGVSEAYVQLRELFYSPATLKLGRQSLNYGTGLIISSADQMYTFDAGRLVLDYHPFTIDIVGAQLVNDQNFEPAASRNNGQSDMLFVNGKYEVNGSVVKNIEGYFGWASQMRTPQQFGINTATKPSPLLIGLRTDLTPCENLTASLEGAYEFGNANSSETIIYGPSHAGDKTISAFLLNAALKYTLKGVVWTPVFNASYTYASGDSLVGNADHSMNTRHTFVPWFGMAEGYNGYVFAPALSNIQIFNLGASVKPAANTTLALQGYYYLKANRNGIVSSDPNANLGGLGSSSMYNDSRDVGAEIDAIVGYDYSKDVRCQLVYGALFPNTAMEGISRTISQVRGELNVKF